MTEQAIIRAFYDESFDLALASETDVLRLSEALNNGDMYSRWVEYQEELRIMLQEFA